MVKVNTDLSKEQLQQAQDTMNYIKEHVIVKNKSGEYTINQKELESPSFDDEEKKVIKNFVDFMNESQGVQLKENAFTRCLQDALNISKSMAQEVAREVEKGNWLAAAGKLVSAGLFANPVSAFAFFMLCGAEPVS